MSKSPTPEPALDILGKRDLELGPFTIDGARDDSPWKHWRMRTDEDGIAWLLFDKKDASTNTMDEDVLIEQWQKNLEKDLSTCMQNSFSEAFAPCVKLEDAGY